MVKRPLILSVVCLCALGISMRAQIVDYSKYKDYKEVSRDTVTTISKDSVYIKPEETRDAYMVMSNSFLEDWFITGTAGLHSFRGDYSKDGPFSGTISPDFSLGFGKWITPWIALRLEFSRSMSRGYTEYQNGHYGYGDWITSTKSETGGYRKMKTGWWDLGFAASLNIVRLYKGYEGIGSKELMNQLVASFGIGMVHHLGYGHGHGSDNEISARTELRFSHFFTPKKILSLDLIARGLFYQSNFDLEYGQYNHKSSHFDANLGIHAGVTYYFGKRGVNRGWKNRGGTVYMREVKETRIPVLMVKEEEKEAPVRTGTITFFVFYPNNYSGRNDAPLSQESPVNAIDYLAGGIYTQKRYKDTDAVTQALRRGNTIVAEASEEIPTEPANSTFEIDYIPRGYEMQKDKPMSLSLSPQDLTAFKDKAGFYYAPIFDGIHNWGYRIDNSAFRQ